MALWKRRQQHYWNSLLMGASHRYTNHCHNQNKLNENGRNVRWVIKSGWLNCVNFMASILQYRFSSQQVNGFTRIIKISDGTTECVIRCSKNWWLLIWIMRPNEWTNRMEKRELANTLTSPAVCICVVVIVHWNQIKLISFIFRQSLMPQIVCHRSSNLPIRIKHFVLFARSFVLLFSVVSFGAFVVVVHFFFSSVHVYVSPLFSYLFCFIWFGFFFVKNGVHQTISPQITYLNWFRLFLW